MIYYESMYVIRMVLLVTLPVTISREYAYNLFLQQNGLCALSGLFIEFGIGQSHYWKRTTASLDRIDSSKGYVEGNVQWVHKDLNRMKHKHNQEYFISLCKKVGAYMDKKHNNQILVILQGHPGSGKSTLAQQIAKVIDAKIFSTDDFFIVDGNYKFDASKLGLYHKLNFDRAAQAMENGYNVIIDNTNVNCWECKNYVQTALKLNIDVRFVRATGNFQNTHGVPFDKVEKMRSNLEELTIDKVLASKAPWE